MNHLIICREYPPAPSGGIGTYTFHLSRLLAEAGETVHVIGQIWEGADVKVEQKCQGRLIIHRVPFENWTSLLPRQPHPELSGEEKSLFASSFSPQCYSWKASLLAEQLVEKEGIDVIEAHDYEAPLYYFQIRRALGKGPRRQPPCFVHLHSPTEFIARHNDWDLSLPAVVMAKRLEDYSILAADALLCPSRYLARQAESHYGLRQGSIQVIPLPIGNTGSLERREELWANGTICYLGRLERRKGVIEWIEAAVKMAPLYPDARFEFIGKNCLGTDKISGEDFLKRLIPAHLRSRFLFRGEQSRSSLPDLFSRSRIAVVPSRWENFPNTCVEAMSAGLPVIATRNGGMAEMLEDGRTGWLAREANSEALAEALIRALDTPPAELADMGRRAAEDIRRMCDNDTVVESHIDFRKRLVRQGVGRSLRSPSSLPSFLADESSRRKPLELHATGLAAVVVCREKGRSMSGCLSSLERQTRKPAAVAIVHNLKAEAGKAQSRARAQGWQVIYHADVESGAAINAGIEAVEAMGINPLGFIFLDESDRLSPDFIAECESTLNHCAEAGIVSCWTAPDRATRGGRMRTPPCPAFPYQWAENEAAPFSAVRAEALKEAGGLRAHLRDGYESWDLSNAVMAAGWVAVTIPALLGECENRCSLAPRSSYDHVPGRMRKEMLGRFPDLIARDAADIVLLAESNSLRNGNNNPRDAIVAMRMLLRSPRQTTLVILGRMKRAVYRKAARMFSLFNS
jgi:glycosyltransferase involved in cell wall biosynthesis